MADQNQDITNSGNSIKQMFEYISPEKVFLNLPFILTQDKILNLGMPYMVHEKFLADSKTDAIRLLDIWNDDHLVYLKVQSLKTLKIDTLIWNLQMESDNWIWSISDFQTLLQSSNNRVGTF